MECAGFDKRQPPYEVGEIGANLFHKACEFGLESLVLKRADRPTARSMPDWLKMGPRIAELVGGS